VHKVIKQLWQNPGLRQTQPDNSAGNA